MRLFLSLVAWSFLTCSGTMSAASFLAAPVDVGNIYRFSFSLRGVPVYAEYQTQVVVGFSSAHISVYSRRYPAWRFGTNLTSSQGRFSETLGAETGIVPLYGSEFAPLLGVSLSASAKLFEGVRIEAGGGADEAFWRGASGLMERSYIGLSASF